MANVFKNGQVIKYSQLKRLALNDFRSYITRKITEGKSLISLFSIPEKDQIALCAILGDRQNHSFEAIISLLSEDRYLSITPECFQAHLFEREIAEQYDIQPINHPWLKPVRVHSPQDKQGRGLVSDGVRKNISSSYDYFKVDGEEIHEVAVGPVHAGIIEPGHFRFQCHGENVLYLEIQLGYQHRGIESAILSNPKRRLSYMEIVAGDTTIGHALTYCRITEALSAINIDEKTDALRAVVLELERLANHVGDLGAIAGDIGYLPTMSFCGRIRGDLLNMTALICGNRFGRGLLGEGGVRYRLSEDIKIELLKRMANTEKDIKSAVKLLWQTPSVLTRFENTGIVSFEMAVKLGLVGPAARASGLKIDARKDFPSGIYLKKAIKIEALSSGDVYARAVIRWREIKKSIAFFREVITLAVDNPVLKLRKDNFVPDSFIISMEEGWRGEICHVARTDGKGKIDFYKITDPSFKNWMGLAWAMRGEQISDFPLCNKSFNLSYCGHDL